MRLLVVLITLTVVSGVGRCRQPAEDSSATIAIDVSQPQPQPQRVQMDAAPDSTTSSPSASPLDHLMTSQPDSTGLIGDLLDGRPMLFLNLWANQRRSPMKPRKREMNEATLMRLLGSDYQPTWMRKSRENVNQEYPPEERPAVRALRQLVKSDNALSDPDLRLPAGLSSEAREIVASWLVKRATCPVRFVWADLGPYFWPRWLRRGECGRSGGDVDDDDDDEYDDYGNVDALGVRASRGRNMTDTARSCSWPPGMKCVPGVARTLHLLRWHCRLRKESSINYNSILNGPLSASGKLSVQPNSRPNGRPGGKSKGARRGNGRQKRSKYRCAWIKVPYSVPEDCVCSV